MDNKKEMKQDKKKEYFPPKIVHTEKLTAMAVSCAKSDSTSCAAGPIQS